MTGAAGPGGAGRDERVARSAHGRRGMGGYRRARPPGAEGCRGFPAYMSIRLRLTRPMTAGSPSGKIGSCEGLVETGSKRAGLERNRL